ncbi:hypothetical protein A6V36_24965 [Paraburkholderia ginsengiterrae]|uniref:Acyltransferase 3 domain-containing protein n=1 Tax=Paraburkholderia ginsengiterrae TaxID=1462993 RepID=A0A1A9N4D6_9BURK|nr:acyltransferase [Paraburkholderia ginsengiterrae]OAJ57308.1 hypothetical protein A6V37_29635 [Paraburkholderia ginsengiterrae]OAJ60912.1 hypothetical protein A6V36_24965 [Paraburkholderia ginsengiterrae]
MGQNKRLEGLQSLRGLAALAVVFQHVTFYSTNAKGLDYLPYLRIDFGRLGVGLFFVISGFVMAGCLSQGSRFLLNRVVRIYPGFWLAVLVSGALLTGPTFGWTFDPKSLLLIPSPLNNSYRVPYWTLVYEMSFYVATYAFIVLRASRYTIAKCCIGWLVVVIAVTKYKTIAPFEPGSWILLSRWNVYFILGMLLGLYFKDVSRMRSPVIAVGAAVLWCIGDTFAGAAPLPSDLMLALAFCGVVLVGVRHIRITALETIGNASFGIYLIHVPVAVLAIHLVTNAFPGISLHSLWLVTMVAALTASFAFGLMEAKIHSQVKKIFVARSPSSFDLKLPR